MPQLQRDLPVGLQKEGAQGLLPLPAPYHSSAPAVNPGQATQQADVANDSKLIYSFIIFYHCGNLLFLCFNHYIPERVITGYLLLNTVYCLVPEMFNLVFKNITFCHPLILSCTSSYSKKPWPTYFTGSHLICFGSICHSLPFQCSPHQGQAHTSQQGLRLSTALYNSGETLMHERKTDIYENFLFT